MKASLLTIGDELLIGQVVNTNASWIGQRLSESGIDLVETATVSDGLAAIKDSVKRLLEQSDFVMVTGGLGPTRDDVTKRAVAELFDAQLAEDRQTADWLVERFRQRNRPVPPMSMVMAMVPEGFDVIPNPVGAAPGLWKSLEGQDVGKHILLVPGVPREMKALFDLGLQRLRHGNDLPHIVHLTLRTSGVGESTLSAIIGELDEVERGHVSLAYLPNALTGVKLRLTAKGDEKTASERVRKVKEQLHRKLGTYIYAEGDISLEDTVGRMLKANALTIAIAESCTGGLIQSRITDVPGSSAYALGGVVAYSNDLKTKLLGVDPELIEAHGAVSEPVVKQMAEGVRMQCGADIGLSTSGIAGPSGGTPEKPVGTLWLGYSDASGTSASLVNLTTDRQINKELGSSAALNLIRLKLLEKA